MDILFFAILLICCFLVYIDVQNSLKYLLLIGFLQDPFRKTVTGEPAYFIVMVGLLFAVILYSVWRKKGFYYSFEPFSRWNQNIQSVMLIFLLILALQLVHSIVRYGNPIVGAIGLMSYLSPFLAVVVGYFFASNIENIRRFLLLYISVGLVVSVSVCLSFLGSDWRILQEVGTGLLIYDQGTILKSYTGLMRTGELAAWHVSTTACLIFTLAVSSTKKTNYFLVATIVVALMLVVALTGRRKMLMLISLFILLYYFAFAFYKNTIDSKYFLGIFYSLLVVWGSYEILNLGAYSESLRDYLARGTSVFGDAGERFISLGLNPIQWAYNRVGLLGGGLGIASQGSNLFGSSGIAGGAGEGGLGKIMVELGLPGLICVIWLFFVMAKYINRILKLTCQQFVDKRLLSLMLSLSVFITVNGLTFSVATQLYGDIFVLVLLGILGGFVLAIPKLVIRDVQITSLNQKLQEHQLLQILNRA